jgi:hypothetical protein
MPPVEDDWFPSIVPNASPVVAQEQLLEVVRDVQQKCGRKIPATLTGFLRDADRFVATWPELDPYRAVRREPVLGPLNRSTSPSPRPENQCFFAYLSADYPALHGILDRMAMAGLSGEVYLRSAVTALKEQVRSSGLIVHDAPQPMEQVLGRVSMIMHHGGVNTAETALLAGCPQLILPRHLEQKLNADAIESLGVGKGLSGKVSMGDIIQSAQGLCGADYADRATRLAATLQARADTRPLQQILDCCGRLL